MQAYQKLGLTGGIFGIVLVPVTLVFLSIGLSFVSLTDFSFNLEDLSESTYNSIMLSIILSMIAIIVSFALKKPKITGTVLLLLGIFMVSVTGLPGVGAWALFFVAGILAFLARHEGNAAGQDILRERYARGEITKDEFETMRKNLE